MMHHDDALHCAKYLFTQIEDYWPGHRSTRDLNSWANWIRKCWEKPVEDFYPAVDHYVRTNEPQNGFKLASHMIGNGDLWTNWARKTGQKESGLTRDEKYRWAAEHVTRNAPALRTLIFMLSYANGEGRVKVHVHKPFNDQMDPETVWKAMEWLDDHGLVKQEGPKKGDLIPFRIQFDG